MFSFKFVLKHPFFPSKMTVLHGKANATLLGDEVGGARKFETL